MNRLSELEQKTDTVQKDTHDKIDSLEKNTNQQLGAIQQQVAEVSAASTATVNKVLSLEELVRGMASGQQALQSACSSISTSVEHMRDEMLRMNLKRAVEPAAADVAQAAAAPRNA